MIIIEMMILPLQQGIIYGPIDSRRLGKSLGINLMPTRYKLCSFNCVYCHYGLTDVLALNIKEYIKDMPKVTDILAEIEKAMKSSLAFDYITFSGNGEPTLYPYFDEIIKSVVELRKNYRPNVKIALLSNSTGLNNIAVKNCLGLIDLPVFKIDAGNSVMFRKINRPANNINFENIVEKLKQTKNIYIQTVLMDGDPSNVKEDELETYFEKIALIKPLGVQIYSLDRPVANSNIKRVMPDELEMIAKNGSKKTGVKIEAFCM
jgi:wyosine [tRNA(Phe)-imidazoG37] synthetase (radical SAM superfamily)